MWRERGERGGKGRGREGERRERERKREREKERWNEREREEHLYVLVFASVCVIHIELKNFLGLDGNKKCTLKYNFIRRPSVTVEFPEL